MTSGDEKRYYLACLDLKLGETQVARLDAASHVELGFPHDFVNGIAPWVFGKGHLGKE